MFLVLTDRQKQISKTNKFSSLVASLLSANAAQLYDEKREYQISGSNYMAGIISDRNLFASFVAEKMPLLFPDYFLRSR